MQLKSNLIDYKAGVIFQRLNTYAVVAGRRSSIFFGVGMCIVDSIVDIERR